MKKLICILAAMALLAGCAPADAPQTQSPETAPAVEPAEETPAEEAQEPAEETQAPSVAGTYTYEEHLELGGQTIDSTWTLTLQENGTYTLDTQIMGEPRTFTGTYTQGGEPGRVTTGTPAEGAPEMVVFFKQDGSCDWILNTDGTCAPAGAQGGMPGSGATQTDAEYAAVAYADLSPSQVMDIYLPENPTGSDPVILLLHGGGFAFGDQRMELIRPVIEAATANGYVVASADYRKSGEATFPAAVADSKAAVRYLKANADTYGIDPNKVVVWGESAGAYLALMTALTPEVESLNGDVQANAGQDSRVAALVDFYGPVEFYTMDEEFAALGQAGNDTSGAQSFESKFLGQPVGEDEETTYRTWWGSYIEELPEDLDLWAWIEVGDADENVPYTQSENFAAQLAEVIGQDHLQFTLLQGAAHEDPAFYTQENLENIFAFLEQALQNA